MPLPRPGGELFIADGGLETELIYRHGFDLPAFASFPLLEREDGRAALRAYFEAFADEARRQGVGLLIDTATWRANRDWGALLGYTEDDLDRVIRAAVAFAQEIRDEAGVPAAVNGAIGPRGDGYVVGEAMTADEARDYHVRQVATFADAGADMVSAITLTYADEAIGIVRSAVDAGLPAAISFTVETDGRLPSGQSLAGAVERVDAETGGAAAYFMVNCAHPTHFAHVLDEGGGWVDRIGGLRANASAKSHAELDASEELDDGDPAELAARHAELRSRLRNVAVLGGCCGTGAPHVSAVCAAWLDNPS